MSDRSDVEIHTLTGAYALDALSETERVVFEHHLAECSSCAAEVAELQATAVRLGMAVAVTPPESMRADVLAAARTVRQQPPGPPRAVAPGRPGRPRWQTWGAGLAAAACLLVAVVFGVQGVLAQREATQAQEQLDSMLAVLSAPDAEVVTASAGDSNATAVVSRTRGKVAVMARGMPELDDDRAYQVWSIGPSGVHSLGVMSQESNPDPLLGDLADGTSIGVTVEPAGGSDQPSTDPVMTFDLPT